MLLLFAADRIERAPEIFVRARFHFDEDERVAVATNQIDLTAAPSAKVAVENFVAVSSEKTAGQFLSTGAELQVLR